jgi:uncharacterized protein YggE
MRPAILLAALLLAGSGICSAQVGGNFVYAQTFGPGRTRAMQNEWNRRAQAQTETPPASNTMFLEAAVLMNVKADEYVAVFGITQEADTVADCHKKMDAAIKDFSDALSPLGVRSDEASVDFVAQNRIYGFHVDGNVAKEEVAGFELKKNVSVRYQNKSLLDKFVVAASRAGIFDLVKVDYVVKDPEAVRKRLKEEAADVLKRKAAEYEKLLGIRFLPQPQVYAEKPAIYFPSDMYDSYTAFESEQMDRDQYRSKYAIQSARKSRTFFYNGLNADGFDRVVNPMPLEPAVQFTLYLKVKYDLEPRKSGK